MQSLRLTTGRVRLPSRTGTTTGLIADAKEGSPNRTVVSLGNTPLKVTSDDDGKVTVFVLGTRVERFTVTGLVTSGTFQPSHSVTIKVRAQVDD